MIALAILWFPMSSRSGTAEQIYVFDNARFEFVELGVDNFQRIILRIVRIVVGNESVYERIFQLGRDVYLSAAERDALFEHIVPSRRGER